MAPSGRGGGAMMPVDVAEPTEGGIAAPTDAGQPVRSRDIETWERPLLEELGGILEQARVDAGIELRDLEPIVGSASSLRNIERGIMRTHASRIQAWLGHLGVDPAPVLAHYAAVIVPDRPNGRRSWTPVVRRPTRRSLPGVGPLDPPPLSAHAEAALGAELWRLRAEARLTRPELAREVGCHRMTIWLVEHGHHRATAELVDAWLEATGADVDRLALGLRFPGRIAPDWRRRRRLAPPDQSDRAPTAAKRPRTERSR